MEFDWTTALIAGTFVLLTINSIRLRQGLSKSRLEIASFRQEASNELIGVTNGSAGVGRRLLELEHEYRELVNRLDTLEHDDPARVAYSEAGRLVDLGAEIEDLINSCGISRPEAELVSVVHKRNRQSQAMN